MRRRPSASSQDDPVDGLSNMAADHTENTKSPEAAAPSALTTFTEHRSLLFSIAYRMMGTVADAEDVLQDAFIRWQQAPRGDIRSPKAFLVTIVSRLCLNHLQSAHAQREQYVGQWLPEPVVTDAASDPASGVTADESISMAFLVVMERLNPIERAVFLLREVFDCDYAEISAAVGRTEANCRQILRRAKEHVQAARPRFTASARERSDLLPRFVQAAARAISRAWLRCSRAMPYCTRMAAARRRRYQTLSSAQATSRGPFSAAWPSSRRRISSRDSSKSTASRAL